MRYCTSDRTHGHVKQLFSTQTQIQSLSRIACMCVNDDAQQHNHVQVSHRMTTSRLHKNVPSNRHFPLDLSHAPSLWGETSRRTATRERDREHRKTGAVRPSVMSDHPREAHTCCSAESVDVPSTGRPTPGKRLPVFSPCVHVTSAHSILQQRNTICERPVTC